MTTVPNELMARLHNRMPAILYRAAEEEWLSREVTDPHQVERLLQPYPADDMTASPVGPAVNNTRNDDPRLIEPVDGEEAEGGRRKTPDGEQQLIRLE